jgi:hypothetical protein
MAPGGVCTNAGPRSSDDGPRDCGTDGDFRKASWLQPATATTAAASIP